MELEKSMHVSAAGLKAQGTRLRVIAENLANANSLAQEAGGEPYRRKLVAFANELDRALGVEMVRVSNILTDHSAFKRELQPGHPAADEDGYVLRPNVNSLMEMSDMREAQRSYEANLRAIQTARTMLRGTIDLLR